MITVHHLNQSRSKRVLWLLEELNTPYQLVKHQRDETTHLAPDSLRRIHPLAKAPVIVDGDLTLCESGAVMEYILNQDSQQRLRPALEASSYYHYLEWLHFAEGSLGLPVLTRLFMGMEKRDNQQPMDGYIAKELALDFAYIESRLIANPYFAGVEFSAADIMMTIMLEIASTMDLLADYPQTLEFLQTMQQRPAYQRAASHG